MPLQPVRVWGLENGHFEALEPRGAPISAPRERKIPEPHGAPIADFDPRVISKESTARKINFILDTENAIFAFTCVLKLNLGSRFHGK